MKYIICLFLVSPLALNAQTKKQIDSVDSKHTAIKKYLPLYQKWNDLGNKARVSGKMDSAQYYYSKAEKYRAIVLLHQRKREREVYIISLKPNS